MDLLESLAPEIMPREEWETKQVAIIQARGELTAARALLAKMRAARPLNLLAAEAQLRTAQTPRTAQTSLEHARQSVPLRSLENARRVAAEHLRAACLYAPTRGRILRILGRPGEVAGPQPLLQMADTRQMLAIAEVYETEIGRVRRGQAAVISSPALAGMELRGTVEQIGSLVGRNKVFDRDPTADVDRRVVEVTIRLEPNEVASRLINLQVYVTIAGGTQDD